MRIVTNISEMQALSSAIRLDGKKISFVPTMGFLHEGHISLMHEGRRRGDLLVVSIFVNPTQFGAGEDFEVYPRNLERDCALAETASVDVIFAPHAPDMYPQGFQTFLNVEELSLPLCGASRPGHFRGVTTVVMKLFHIVMPHVAIFGQKDYQQLSVIKRMVQDLNLDVAIVGMPILRETDGLAMSSRNVNLSTPHRQAALCLNRALASVRQLFASGEHCAEELKKQAAHVIAREPSAVVDYIELRDGDTLEDVREADERTLLALAVKFENTRLIDNCILGE